MAAEFALVQTRPSALEDAIHSGNGNPKKLNLALKMTQNLNEYLSTTQVGVSVAGIILGWIGESTVETILVDLLGLTHLISNGG
ncbi:CNNM domain-containing protein, partial [Staphylococcus epidermidis]|uniref:CNNM domain-containing protein n=1 Tax=Staphylococcus epidermidis TaxID=1282 RepID=UPI00311F0B7E